MKVATKLAAAPAQRDQNETFVEGGTWSPSLDLSETTKELLVRGEAPGMGREREEGRSLRTVRLPSAVTGDGVDARYADGALTIQIPKAAPDARSRVTVT